MKAGRVVRLRLNPKDCMAAVDIVQRLGLLQHGMSFSQVVSLALGSLLETARLRGLAPRRDGFEYLEMMAPFGDNSLMGKARKLAITELLDSMGEKLQVPAQLTEALDQAAAKRTRLAELKQLIGTGNAGAAETEEYRALVEELFDPTQPGGGL